MSEDLFNKNKIKKHKCKNNILNCHLNNCSCLKKRQYVDYDENLYLSNINKQNDKHIFDISEESAFISVYNFHQKTDYKKFKNLVCCICSERKIVPIDIISFEQIATILKFKKLLDISNLSYNFDKINFTYNTPFNVLNNMVLEKQGFDIENNKCVVCNSCIYYLKKNQIPTTGLINELYLGKFQVV